MTFYWLLFFTPALWTLIYSKPLYPSSRTATKDFLWFLVLIGLTVLIGLRHHVGGDWIDYLSAIETARALTLEETVSMSDPGYALLNWIGAHWGGGIYLVNTICGLFFTLGLISFCRVLPRPMLGLTIAIPYLVIVVAMGYSRQAVAVGIAMWGLVFLQRGLLFRFFLAIALASLFHKSAIVLILIALGAQTKNKILTIIATVSIGTGLYVFLMADAVQALREGYLDAEYQSSGAAVRIAMNALPGIAFLWLKKRFILDSPARKLWTYMAWTSIGFVGLLFVSPSSTAVDRVALYLLPLQLFVWSHLPDVIGRVGRKNLFITAVVLSFYAGVLTIWLFFADNRYGWIPYRFFPLELLN